MTTLTSQLLRVYYSIKKMLLTVYEIVNDCEHFFLQDSCNFQHKKNEIYHLKKIRFVFVFNVFKNFIWFSKMANSFP